MSTNLRNALADMLAVVEPFKDDIPNILLKRTPNNDIAMAAKSRHGNISITGNLLIDVPELRGVACLGSIPYLSAIVGSKYIKGKAKFSVELAYDESKKDGKDLTLLKSMLFQGGKMESFYQATDPFINKINRVKAPPATKVWPVTFEITPELTADFNEIMKVHRAAPKVGGDRDDVFKLIATGSSISATFGERGHLSSVVLTEDAHREDTGDGVDNFHALFSVTQFQAILKLIGKGTGKANLSLRSLRVDINTEIANYSLTIIAKKLSG